MNNYLKTLLEYFADGTELDVLQMRTLMDNNLVKSWHELHNECFVLHYALTNSGKQLLKGN